MSELIVICGSVNKNEVYFEYWNERLKFAGFETILPFDVPFHRTHEPKEKTANRIFYYERIDKCYAIVVVNDIDYVGFETSMEIGYAYARNKLIYFTNGHSKIDEIRSLLQEGRGDLINNLIWEGLRKKEMKLK